MKYFTFSLISFCLLVKIALGQKSNDGLIVRMDGFLINLDGQVLFQPCEDSSLGFWQSLDSRSFSLWCNQISGDHYCDATKRLGDSLSVRYKFVEDTFYNEPVRLSYFYCTIEAAMMFIGNNENDFKVHDKPKILILHKGKSYPINGFYIRDILRKVIPARQGDILKMYNYYVDNDFTIPKWLQNELMKKSGK
jgi:hypothetical protein